MRGFASDNISGVHPKILEAIHRVNIDHTEPYGHDVYTKNAKEKFKTIFGQDTDIYFLYNGTAANVLSLAAITRPYNSIICAGPSHINTDECGAPEKFTGCKLIHAEPGNSKLSCDSIKYLLKGFGFEHHSQPKVISITQPAENGEVYTPEEIYDIASLAHSNGLLVHMDGARIANAAAFLNMGLKSFTKNLGVDVLSFGGTKNGAMFGDAAIFFNPRISKNFKYIRKQGMQLGSKMRFVAAQFDALLTDDLWLKNATHANQMAKYLYEKITALPNVTVSDKVQTNAVFAVLPENHIEKLKKKYYFYIWDETVFKVRFMTSFDTTPEDVDTFFKTIKGLSQS